MPNTWSPRILAARVASDEENAAALPVAVRFVTQTYQSEIEEISPQGRNDSGEGV